MSTRGYSMHDQIQNRVAASLGYPIAEGVDARDLEVGDGVIVITRKGELLMTGQIESIEVDESMEDDDGNSPVSVSVGGTWWSEIDYIFRRL
jgi:hypothetical protein